jgi:hypothetical protein
MCTPRAGRGSYSTAEHALNCKSAAVTAGGSRSLSLYYMKRDSDAGLPSERRRRNPARAAELELEDSDSDV